MSEPSARRTSHACVQYESCTAAKVRPASRHAAAVRLSTEGLEPQMSEWPPRRAHGASPLLVVGSSRGVDTMSVWMSGKRASITLSKETVSCPGFSSKNSHVSPSSHTAASRLQKTPVSNWLCHS